MHARSDAWRCCDGKGRGTWVLCELLLAATLFSVELWISIDMYCWEAAKLHKPRSLNYCFVANQWVLFFAMPFLPYKGFALTGHLKTAKCEWLWAARIAMCECLRSRANCRVRMFWSNWIKQKLSNLYMICSNSVKKFLSNFLCTLHWHAFKMLYTNGSFEI